MRSRTALLTGVVLLLAAGAAAEHDVPSRYVVLGYVKDARGKPVADKTVELIRDKTGFSYLAETDARGFYVLIARLGDESAGEALTLRVDRLSRKLTARFDAANHADERGTRLDLEGAKFVERPSWFRSTLARFLGAPTR